MLKKKRNSTYTIDKDVIKEFDKKAIELSINKSALIENLIKKWLKENA